MTLSPQLLCDLLIALLPALAWLAFFLAKDRYEPEPRGLVAMAFVYGMLMVPVARFLEGTATGLLGSFRLSTTAQTAFVLLAVVAPVEEVLKFAVVRLRFYPDPEFNEPMDGIVYATTVGIGFSTLENALYMVTMGAQVLLLRAAVSTMLHVGCAGMVGYALGRMKFGRCRPDLMRRTLLTAIAFHGSFDLLLVLGARAVGGVAHGIVLALLVGSIFWLYNRLDVEIDESLRRSPFRPRRRKGDPGGSR